MLMVKFYKATRYHRGELTVVSMKFCRTEYTDFTRFIEIIWLILIIINGGFFTGRCYEQGG